MASLKVTITTFAAITALQMITLLCATPAGAETTSSASSQAASAHAASTDSSSAHAASTDPATTSSAAGQRPNIVLIISDDQGYADLGVQGQADIPTPHIDSIAKDGVRFTSGYVSAPVCSPTRAGLLSGRYQSRFGHEMNPGNDKRDVTFGLPLSEQTLPARLKEAGYATGMFGKWHLGNEKAYHPQSRGFDEFFGFVGGGHDYLEPGQGTNVVQHNGKPVTSITYLTDDFGAKAAQFIHQKSHTGQPFFVYLPFNAVHTPMQAPEKYMQRFANIPDRKRRAHAAMLFAMDDAVGRVLEAIEQNGQTSNTLVFYISDNGGPTPSNASSNAPLRGYKRDLYEGGIRVPFLVKWPGEIPPGEVYEQPVISLDIHATALAAAGTTAPAGMLDGVNLLPYIDGTIAAPPHDALYWRFGPQWAVRAGDWKLLLTGHPGVAPQLFNLASDIREKTDLAAKNPDKASELKTRFDAWNGQLVEPLWAKDTNLTGASTGDGEMAGKDASQEKRSKAENADKPAKKQNKKDRKARKDKPKATE